MPLRRRGHSTLEFILVARDLFGRVVLTMTNETSKSNYVHEIAPVTSLLFFLSML
jgi:hypothetical protein